MPIIGLDLGQHSFRAVEIEKGVKGNTLLNIGSFENPNLNLESSEKQDIDSYASGLKDFVSECKFSTNDIILGLEESSVFMRIIQVPTMSDRDLKNAIQYESEKYIPLPLDQVNLSYQKLDSIEDGKKINVQIVAAKKQKVSDYVEIVKRAGLRPIGIEPETLALGRCLGDTPDVPNGTIILNMGFTTSLVVVVYGGYVRFTRTIPIGGDVITKAIQQNLGLDYNQAEEYKKTYGLDNSHFEGKLYDIIKPVFDQITMEIKRAVIFFTNSTPGATIKRIVVSGGTAHMPNLIPYLVNTLGLEVELAFPFNSFSISPKMPQAKIATVKDAAPGFATALGLAMKEF